MECGTLTAMLQYCVILVWGNVIHFTNNISCRYSYKKPRDPWHGLWWIVLLMYTHVVHTSMSILNCPILPGRSGDYVPVSAI